MQVVVEVAVLGGYLLRVVNRAVTGHGLSLLRLVNVIEVRMLFAGVELGKK